jgi:hypothetical protein
MHITDPLLQPSPYSYVQVEQIIQKSQDKFDDPLMVRMPWR